MECTVEQRSELILGLITHVSKVTITSWCSVRAHQVQMKNLPEIFGKLLPAPLSAPCFSFSASSVVSIVLIWCVFSETSVKGTLKKNLLNK